MTWDTIQQVVRIVLYAGGSAALGAGVADGETFQAAIGGVVSVGAFVWWFFREREKAS